MPRAQKPKCVGPDCNARKILARGLCESCYRAAARMVRLKKMTWKQLEDRELAKPADRGNRGGKMFRAIVGKK